ncbi:MAG: hypothetical protein ABR915_25730, partial [Thermoguttaceae bacterium]
DGPAAGLSTRIVGVNPTNPGKMQAMAFEGGSMPAAGNHYIINGLAYSGAGSGYNSTTGALDAAVSIGGQTCPLALVPFHVGNWGPKDGNFQNQDPANLNPPGGANVDYTAPDFQNMLLAYQVPNGSGGVWTPLPSLHRPELVQYWASKAGVSNPQNPLSWASKKDLLRAIMARPNVNDHPNFTGSNPNFNPVWDGKTQGQGQWDVCNDGSGVPDSIWVDLGFPVRFRADGKAYKPLFAILVLDMDGRLNVNAHGMLAQADVPGSLPAGVASYYSANGQLMTAGGNAEVPVQTSAPAAIMAPAPGTTATLPRGLGYGPPEVNLLPLFGGTANVQYYRNLLVGSAGLGLNGRYGELGAATPQPGVANTLWPDTFNKWFDYTGSNPAGNVNYWSYRTNPGSYWADAYGSPPDPGGCGAVGMDLAGRPLFMSLGGSCTNTAYDLNLSRNAPHAVDSAPADDPFGPAELEAVLRPFDRDAPALPKRLLALTATDSSNYATTSPLTQRRYAVGADGQSVPCPGLALSPSSSSLAIAPKTWHQAMQAVVPDGRPRHIVDLLRAVGATTPASWGTLLPAEMFAGLKLNLNRPLSNWAAASPAGKFQLYSKPGAKPDWSDPGGGFTFSPIGDATGKGLQSDPTLANPAWPEAVLARQLQARYLYVLAMLLWEQNGSLQAFTEFSAADPRAQALTQRRIAQWAINAVCFSTPDSVMVPFKYPLPQGGATSPDFSHGWTLDNKIDSTTADGAGTFGVVWGSKPPELLLTEAAAWHDRRVADTNWNDSADPKRKQKMRLDLDNNDGYWKIMDQSLNQTRIPQGSAFIELFCPRSPRLSAAPTDLYAPVADSFGGGQAWSLDLGQLAGAPPGQP